MHVIWTPIAGTFVRFNSVGFHCLNAPVRKYICFIAVDVKIREVHVIIITFHTDDRSTAKSTWNDEYYLIFFLSKPLYKQYIKARVEVPNT